MFQSISFPYEDQLMREIELRGYSLSTFKNYKSHLRRLAEFCSKDICQVEVEECKQYLLYLQKDLGFGPDTTNTCVSAFLFFQQAVLGNPISPVALPKRKKPKALPVILSKDQIFSLLDAFPLRNRTVLSLCYGSGLRLREALSLRIQDIDSKTGRLFVYYGKGGSDRYTILSAFSLALLRRYYKAYRPKGPLLFPGRSGDRPLASQHIQAAFKSVVFGMFPLTYEKITIHTLRHCFATHLLDQNYDLRTIQLLLGHKSIQSTCIYLHLSSQRFSMIISPLDRKDGDSPGL